MHPSQRNPGSATPPDAAGAVGDSAPARFGAETPERVGLLCIHPRLRAAPDRVRIGRSRPTSGGHHGHQGDARGDTPAIFLIPVTYYVVERFAANRRKPAQQGVPADESSIVPET